MKRVSSILLILLLCISIFSGCRGEETSTSSDSSWQKVAQTKQLQVGVYTDQFPLSYRKGDVFAGYDVELTTEVAERIGVEAVFHDISESGKTAQELLNSDEVDCIIGAVAYDSGLERDFLTTEPYLSDRQVLLLRKDSDVQNLADLTGLRLGVASGSLARKGLEKSPLLLSSFAGVKEEKTEQEVITALLNGDTDIVAVNESIARRYIATGSALRLLTDDRDAVEVFGTVDYVVLFALGDETLKKKLESAYTTMERDAIVTALQNRWFKSGDTSSQPENNSNTSSGATSIPDEEAAAGSSSTAEIPIK